MCVVFYEDRKMTDKKQTKMTEPACYVIKRTEERSNNLDCLIELVNGVKNVEIYINENDGITILPQTDVSSTIVYSLIVGLNLHNNFV